MTQIGIDSGALASAGDAPSRRRPPRGGPPRWLSTLAMLAVPVLLLAFVHVARQGVRIGEMRRVAMAAQADATWRCNTTIDSQARERCLQRIDTAAYSAMVTFDDRF